MAVKYMTSIGDPKQLEKLLKDESLDGKTERRLVFAGRSNAGKSSLLNGMTRCKIAQISREPGKTRSQSLSLRLYKRVLRIYRLWLCKAKQQGASPMEEFTSYLKGQKQY